MKTYICSIKVHLEVSEEEPFIWFVLFAQSMEGFFGTVTKFLYLLLWLI